MDNGHASLDTQFFYVRESWYILINHIITLGALYGYIPWAHDPVDKCMCHYGVVSDLFHIFTQNI